MSDNINSKEYWDNRFASEDWERKLGRAQTLGFARAQCPLMEIDAGFAGVITDFGCGLGDAIPVYHEFFPNAKLIGTDLSVAAIDKCRQRYGSLAEFVSGDHFCVPQSDIIIASNVFEHLSSDLEVARELSTRCKRLYIVVPFEEAISPGGEHINSYSKNSFSSLLVERVLVFPSPGWTEYGIKLFLGVYVKNVFRFAFGRPLKRRSLQIMFQIKGLLNLP